MKKMISVRNGVIVALCVTIVLMAIGFCVLSFKLQEKSRKEEKFDVAFVKVSKDSVVKAGVAEPQGDIQVESHGKKLGMNFTLYEVNDEFSYTVIVKNRGTIPARIIELIGSPDYKDKRFSSLIEPVRITYDDVAGRELDPQEELEFKITVSYNKSSLVGARNVNCKLGLISESADD